MSYNKEISMGNNKSKRNLFLKIEKDFRLQLLTCVVLCAIIILFFLFINNIIEWKNVHEYTIVDDTILINDIENIATQSDTITIEGYAFMSDRDSSDSKISAFLLNIVTKNEIWLDMKQIDRSDVNSYFISEYDYKNSGFIAYTNNKDFDIDDTYEIILNIDYIQKDDNGNNNVRKTVSTNHYISDGELYGYNPLEFDEPDMNIESELLKEVFENGQLCLYQKEEGLYVYEYERRLYWIATEDFKFEDSEETYIIYYLYTSQIDKLPEHRVKHKFDNKYFYFENHEYTDEKTEPYRVAIHEIPDGYVTTKIKTGVRNIEAGKVSWEKSFQLDQKIN